MKNENKRLTAKEKEDFSNQNCVNHAEDKISSDEENLKKQKNNKNKNKNENSLKKSNKNWLKSSFKTICLSPVWFFKFCISPLLPHSCIFVPTCSNYMIFAVKEFGVFKGFWLGTKRLFRCVPWQKKRGLDPVPINIKGEHIWIL